MLRTIIIILFAFLSLPAFSQWQKQDTTYKGLPLTFSYFSDHITHPGVRFGFEHSVSIKYKYKYKKDTILKFREKHWVLSGNTGFYHHTQFNTGLFAMIELSRRKIRTQGFYYELGCGIGNMRVWLPGKKYEILDDGTFDKKFMMGQNYFINGVHVTLGKTFFHTRDYPFRWYFKHNLWMLAPYNSFVTFFWGVETGFAFTFGYKPNSDE
jgi:hypothetical protein